MTVARASTPSFRRLTSPATHTEDTAHERSHSRLSEHPRPATGLDRSYTEANTRAHSIPSERRFVIDKDKLEPRTILGFGSPLEADRGKIVSQKGTFAGRYGTNTDATRALLLLRRQELLRRRGLPASEAADELPPMPPSGSIAGCEVAYYSYPSVLAERFKHSLGVTRTAPRWQAAVTDESPGPIFYPNPDPRPRVGAVFSRAKRFEYDERLEQDLKVVRPCTPRREVAGRLAMLAAAREQAVSDAAAPPSRCTFGHRLPPAEHFSDNGCPKHTFESENTNAHFVPGVAMRASRRAPRGAIEVTPGPGHFHRAGYHASTPVFSMGRRLRRAPDASPGPQAYDVVGADARMRRRRT